MAGGIPIAPRLLVILADGSISSPFHAEWKSRSQLAIGLKRSYGLGPSDLNALDKLERQGLIEREWRLTRGMNGHWVYRITATGQAVAQQMKHEQEMKT